MPKPQGTNRVIKLAGGVRLYARATYAQWRDHEEKLADWEDAEEAKRAAGQRAYGERAGKERDELQLDYVKESLVGWDGVRDADGELAEFEGAEPEEYLGPGDVLAAYFGLTRPEFHEPPSPPAAPNG